jgi:ABC-type glycerol-3-phosphate transport system substrate-binding protein
MTPRQISCQRARALLPGHLDGTITLGDREQLEAHWATCAACNEERRSAEALDTRTRAALRAVMSGSALSPQRAARIRRSLVGGQAHRRFGRHSNFSGVVAGLAALMLLVSVSLGALRPATPAPAPAGWLNTYANARTDRDLAGARGRLVPIRSAATIAFLDASIPPAAYASLVEQFQARNPDVTVQVRQPVAAANDHAALAAEGDCFVGSASVASPAARASLQVLTRFAQADAQINTDDFFPSTLTLTSYGDQLFGLPRSVRLRLTFFDRPALARANVPPPQRGWTTDDLAASARALRDELPPDRYPFLAYDSSDVAYLLTQRAGRAPQLGNARIDTGAMAEALGWYASLAQPPAAAPAIGLADPEARALRRAQIADGLPAIWTGPPVPSRYVNTRLGIAPLPSDMGAPSTADADAYFISRATGSPGACWRWIRFLSLQTNAVTDAVPARASQVHSRAYVQKIGTRQAGIVAAALERPASAQPWSSLALAALADAADEVLLRGRAPRAALSDAQHLLDDQ